MSKTFKHLRKIVAQKMRETLHGRKFDLRKIEHPRTPHILGITPVGQVHDATDEDGTILDSSHEFWEDYSKTVETKYRAEQEIEAAIKSLSENDILRISYPYGEEGDIMYVEVDELSPDKTGISMRTECKECNNLLTTRPSLVLDSGYYYLKFTIDCPQCEFRSTYKTSFVKS